MGVDTVSLSTQKNMYTVYRDWRYSDSKLNFKAYLLEKDERIEAFANSFKQYNRGDMFTRETVVELEDGRLLCFDPDEFSKAYLIDLSNVTKDDINFDRETDFKMIKADKSKAGYETRNDAILSYLGSDIKLKDGQTLDSYLNQIEASDDSTQAVSDTTTNLFYYKNISQMSSDDEEQEYYQYIIESLGGSVDNDGKITIGEGALSNLNSKIKLFEKYMSKSDNQSKLNTLVLLQQLGLSELELIEKLTPGFLEQVKSFIGEYEGISYTDDNGFKSSISQVINFEKIMTYKYNNSDQYWMYLSLEDRKGVYNHTTQTFSEDGGVNADDPHVKAAEALTHLSSTTSASLESTMEANLEQRVSASTISDYVEEFNGIFNDDKNGLSEDHTYDEALEYLAMLCTDNVSGEILYEFLQNSDVQKCLITLGIQKGTLPTGKTADKSEEEQLTVQAVYRVMAEKINSYVEETYTIMGDEERIAATKVSNATISFLDMAAGGINVKYNEGQSCFFAYGLGAEAVVQAGLAVWANRAANDIVEKSTTKALENAAKNALDEATKAVTEATNAVNDATNAVNDATNAVNDATNNLKSKLNDVISKYTTTSTEEKEFLEKLKKLNDGEIVDLTPNDLEKLKSLDEKNSTNLFDDLIKAQETLNTKQSELKAKQEAAKKAQDAKTAQDNLKKAQDELEAKQNAVTEAQTKVKEKEAKLKKAKAEAKKNPGNTKLQNAATAAQTNLETAQTNLETAKTNLETAKTNLETAKKEARQAARDANIPYADDAVDLKSTQDAADKAAKELKAAKKTLDSDIDDNIKRLKQNTRKNPANKNNNKKLIDKLRKLKNNSLSEKETEDLLTELKKRMDLKDLTNDVNTVKTNAKKVNETKEALEAAKNLRAETSSGIVDTLNDEMKINRHGAKDSTSVNGKSWLNTTDDVADAIAGSVDLNDVGEVTLKPKGSLKDGVEEVTKKTTKKAAGKGLLKRSSSNATTATKTLRLGGVFSKLFMGVDCVSAAIDGGMMGYGIASWAVENNANNFINEDGSYDTTRANVARGFGAAAGACFGLAVGMWTSGVGAAINAATGGIAGTIVGIAAGAAGAVCTAISAISCFTKWFK